MLTDFVCEMNKDLSILFYSILLKTEGNKVWKHDQKVMLEITFVLHGNGTEEMEIQTRASGFPKY